MKTLVQRIWNHPEIRALAKNLYFLLGLAIQKGMPIFILPLTIKAIGAPIYAEYVLLYTMVQVLGIVGGACVSQGVIPFWYTHDDKERFVGSLTALNLAVQAAMSVPSCVVVYFWMRHGMGQVSAATVALVTAYALVYNLNAIALNVVRVTLRQRAFLWSTAATSAGLIAMILLVGGARGGKLLLFTAANVVVLALQTVLYFAFGGIRRLVIFPAKKALQVSRELLRFSLPMTVYTLITLSALVMDKWVIRLFFPTAALASYIIDFQCAFAVALVSVVIGMYNAQEVCRLVHVKDRSGLRSNVLGNYALSIVGSCGVAAAVFTYAFICHLRVSVGFWLLAVAFTVNNCYAVNSALLTAQKRSRVLAAIGGSCTAVLGGLLLCAGLTRTIGVIYAAYMVYQLLLFGTSTVSVWSVLRRVPTDELVSPANVLETVGSTS